MTFAERTMYHYPSTKDIYLSLIGSNLSIAIDHIRHNSMSISPISSSISPKLSTRTAAQIVKKNKTQPIVLILRKKKKSVTWDESVIDNEFMNKKKSNKCCIYQKPRRWDESDTESETSSNCSDHDHHGHHHHHHHDHKHHKAPTNNDNALTKEKTEIQTQTVAISDPEKDENEQKPKHVTWDESVIDNEFMNKKKSNKCCIYHKPRRWDESDTEETDDSSVDCHMHGEEEQANTNINQNDNNDEKPVQSVQPSPNPNVTSNQAKSEKNKSVKL